MFLAFIKPIINGIGFLTLLIWLANSIFIVVSSEFVGSSTTITNISEDLVSGLEEMKEAVEKFEV